MKYIVLTLLALLQFNILPAQSRWVAFEMLAGSWNHSYDRTVAINLPFVGKPSSGASLNYYSELEKVPFNWNVGLGYLNRSSHYSAGYLWVPLGLEIAHGETVQVSIGAGLDMKYRLHENLDTNKGPERDLRTFSAAWKFNLGVNYVLGYNYMISLSYQNSIDFTPFYDYKGTSTAGADYRIRTYGIDSYLKIGLRRRI